MQVTLVTAYCRLGIFLGLFLLWKEMVCNMPQGTGRHSPGEYDQNLLSVSPQERSNMMSIIIIIYVTLVLLI